MEEDELLRQAEGTHQSDVPRRGKTRSLRENTSRIMRPMDNHPGNSASASLQTWRRTPTRNIPPRNRGPPFKEQQHKHPYVRTDKNINIPQRSNSTNVKNYNNRRAQGDSKKIRTVGFLTLEALVKSDVKDVLANLNDKKEGFMNLLQSPIERPDVYVLVLALLSKICESGFHQLKCRVLLDVCNSQFISNLKNYLLDLPYVEKKSTNSKYWDNEIEFWKNFIIFCDTITVMVPTIAFTKCRALIEGSSKCCLDMLALKHNFILPAEHNLKLIQLRETLTEHESKGNKTKKRKFTRSGDEEQEPPENFRELSVYPRQEDLFDEHPYLRANLINGHYRDVEHYLDVQFRLLREDCFGPLRKGISQLMRDSTIKKYDNMRVYHKVRFVESYVSPQKIGSIVEVDKNTRRRFKKINWAHSKRFIFGSLVLFTKDNFKTLIVATIIDRDLKYLYNGKIPVSIANIHEIEDNLYGMHEYTMIESEVYFEPYYHILKALQDPTFPKHLAMKKYIVDVNPQPTPPAYLQVETTYEVNTHSIMYRFNVLNANTWPSSDELQLNPSQYDAYKTALTSEFAVIQGPPGTGKTYLGIKVAQTLLTNIIQSGCVLLLVCYTNHALDQFLEGLIPYTKSIARIGGQSRNEKMEHFNINKLRKNLIHNSVSRLYHERRHELKSNILKLQLAQKQLDSINDIIISFLCMTEYVPESGIIGHLYKTILNERKDPLCYWLFEHLEYNFEEPIMFEDDQTEEYLKLEAPNDDYRNSRNVIFDDLKIDDDGLDSTIQQAFCLKAAKKKLCYDIKQYQNNCDLNHRSHLKFRIVRNKALIRRFTQMRQHYLQDLCAPQVNLRHLNELPVIDRWMLYFSWTELVKDKLKQDITPLQEDVYNANTAYEESRMLLDITLLKNVKVIGMTTSGAARLRKMLIELAPPIVIVEEAAEVLEQHIVTSLTKNCKHLILIGDHQQLRPSAANLRLATDYQLEVSLFERMVLNGVHSRCLRVQHRMRPSISALVAQHVYTDLADHPSVAAFPDVRGVTANLFFFTHEYQEEVVDDSSSKTNKKEADLTLGLANYIMQQGYEPEDVTILTTYSGQMFYLRQQRASYSSLSKVKITVVDNYQGEESKIILLSLVRNNDQKKIGFLGMKNRICVALSRAKEGLYIFGNINILKENSTLWTKIAETLENNGSLGTSIQLKCENHPDQITTISSVTDFCNKVPEGGCLLTCKNKLACGHACPHLCHFYDPKHTTIKCPLKCERIICDEQHVCPLVCNMKCEPCKILKTETLRCGHSQQMHCYLNPEDPSIKCWTTVSVIIPKCGHKVDKFCFVDIKKVKCLVPCEFLVERCGHACLRKCHVDDDPDHENYECRKPCVRAKEGCSMNLEDDRGEHQCQKMCYQNCDNCDVKILKKRSSCKHKITVACSQNVDKTPCQNNCMRTLPCGHFCKKKCFEKCGDCKIKVKKVIEECGHEVKAACGAEATRALCERECGRPLRCGHACRLRCRELCDPAACAELIPQRFDSPCGHQVQLPCNVYSSENGLPSNKSLLENCNTICGAELECTHTCVGNCKSCLRGRLHRPCAQVCQQINICGHICKEPCSQLCPPCSQSCEKKCVHARCPRPCGAPCVRCKEACARACPHGRCSRLCGEACSREGCGRRCARALACGHACRGLCGERCPDICKICRPDDFPTDFLGDDFPDEALFIVLEDCGHVMELENMEHLMKSESESISLRCCPFCRKTIINTPRYKDLVNHRFKTEINPIKERVFGNKNTILDTKDRLFGCMDTFKETHKEIYSDNRYSAWKNAFHKLQKYVNNNKKYSLLQLNMHFVYLDILKMLSDMYKKYIKVRVTELDIHFIENTSVICLCLSMNIKKIGQQQQMDIHIEIKRMNSIVQLSNLLNVYPLVNKSDSKLSEAIKHAKKMVLTIGIFKEDHAVNALKILQDVIKAEGVIEKIELDMVVRAIGARAGQWYKCPNGHFYSIDRCGGAMEVSRCVECKARIGGTNHALLPDNNHAPEIDNSKFPAWSEEANNMANFNLDNLV